MRSSLLKSGVTVGLYISMLSFLAPITGLSIPLISLDTKITCCCPLIEDMVIKDLSHVESRGNGSIEIVS